MGWDIGIVILPLWQADLTNSGAGTYIGVPALFILQARSPGPVMQVCRLCRFE